MAERLAAKPSVVNTQYALAEGADSADIVPTLIYDDGRFTYLRFPGNREVANQGLDFFDGLSPICSNISLGSSKASTGTHQKLAETIFFQGHGPGRGTWAGMTPCSWTVGDIHDAHLRWCLLVLSALQLGKLGQGLITCQILDRPNLRKLFVARHHALSLPLVDRLAGCADE